MSSVTCQKNKTKKNNGGASRGRVCDQRGLPRLVYTLFRLWILQHVRLTEPWSSNACFLGNEEEEKKL